MATKEKKKTAIVVGKLHPSKHPTPPPQHANKWHTGAGVGGVATAARLAKAGFSVTLLEKNSFTGGRCSLITHDGHRFDQGPSLLLLPKLFQETFADLDTSLSAEGVELLKCEPNYNLWFGDGQSFQLSSDMSVMKREIEKWEGKAGFERYLSWLAEAHRHYEISVREVLHRNFTSVFNLARWGFLRHVVELHPFESIYSRASKYFWTERLRRVFTFGSMYMGMSPFDAPGTYSLLQYTELAEGIWYPVGGFHAVVAALVRICERLGVDIRLNCPVESVLTAPDGKRTTGVQLSSGEKLTADLVVINADLVYAYNNLFPTSPSQSYAQSLQKRAGSCSSISFYWALSQQIPELNTHNIFLADEYRESFDSIFDRQSIPTEPSFYVNVPSRIDPTAAPKGKDSIVVLVPVGHLLNSSTSNSKSQSSGSGAGLKPEQNWPSIVDSARQTIIRTIEARTHCALLGSLITHETLNTPTSWEQTFNLDKGSILGLSHSFFNVLAFRPKTKHPSIKGVYFVGASTHPGTGVPIVLAGAKITTEQILGDWGIGTPWRELGETGVGDQKGKKNIDTVRKGGAILSDLGIWILALVVVVGTLVYINSGLVITWDPELKKGWGSGKMGR
jgi:phytoene desaturase (3,4-didehydrolycopene-forming)